MAKFGKVRISGSFGENLVGVMACHYWAHSYFHNGIDTVRYSFEKCDSTDEIYFEGKKLGEDGITEELHLSVGKNTFYAQVRSQDGSVLDGEFNAFRAYPTPTWEKLSDDAAWCPRDSAGEIVFKDKIWLIGGYVPEKISDVWSSPDAINWTQHPDVPAKKGIDIPVIFEYNDRLYVMDMEGVLWASEDCESWEKVNDGAMWKEFNHRVAGGVFKDKIWLLGIGKDRSILSSSDGGYTWNVELEHAPWSKREVDSTMLVYDDKMWIMGGTAVRRGNGGFAYFPFIGYNDVWCSADGVNWECVTRKAPWDARMWQSTFIYKNRMWLGAGYHSEPESRHFGDLWYTTDGKNWREFKPNAHEWKSRDREMTFEEMIPLCVPAPIWGERHETSMVVKDDTIYLMGGMIWPLTNEIWKLKIDGFCFLSQPKFECVAGVLYEYYAFADFSKSLQDAKYRLIKAPDGLTVEEDTGYVSGVVETAGKYEVVLEAFTDSGETVLQEYMLDIMA